MKALLWLCLIGFVVFAIVTGPLHPIPFEIVVIYQDIPIDSCYWKSYSRTGWSGEEEFRRDMAAMGIDITGTQMQYDWETDSYVVCFGGTLDVLAYSNFGRNGSEQYGYSYHPTAYIRKKSGCVAIYRVSDKIVEWYDHGDEKYSEIIRN